MQAREGANAPQHQSLWTAVEPLPAAQRVRHCDHEAEGQDADADSEHPQSEEHAPRDLTDRERAAGRRYVRRCEVGPGAAHRGVDDGYLR